MVFLCLLQAIAIGIVFFGINSRILFENERENLEQLIGVVNQDLESKIEAINSLSLDLVINSELKKNLNKTDSLEIGRSKKMINDILSDRILSVQGLVDINILDNQGNTYSNNTIFQFPLDYVISQTDAFIKAKQGNGELVWLNNNSIIDRYGSHPYSSQSNTDNSGVNAVAIIKDYTRGEILGLLMISLKSNYFYQLQYSSTKLKNVQLYLVSPDKTKVLPVAGTNGILAPEILNSIKTDCFQNTSIATKKNLVSYIQNKAMGWTFVSISSVTEIKNTYVSIIKVLFVILLGSVTASLFVAWKSTQHITRGVNELVEKMHLVENGNFGIQIDTIRNDEIGILSIGFNTMVQNINQLIDSKYKQELLTKDAEFKVLQAQISPHFLNNTLDMINWKLMEADQPQLSENIQVLGQLFQYSFSKESRVTLYMEIQHVEDYIKLWQASQNPYFTYVRDTTGELDILVPKLSLQPLVENAVLHGFGIRKNGNILKINTYCKETVLYLEVVDNGQGMEEEAIACLLNPNYDSLATNGKIHLGIKNVEQRMKYMYGQKVTLEILSVPGKGTTVRLIIPLPPSTKGKPV
jgi:two-component system sensor histidine kinase YesM